MDFATGAGTPIARHLGARFILHTVVFLKTYAYIEDAYFYYSSIWWKHFIFLFYFIHNFKNIKISIRIQLDACVGKWNVSIQKPTNEWIEQRNIWKNLCANILNEMSVVLFKFYGNFGWLSSGLLVLNLISGDLVAKNF